MTLRRMQAIPVDDNAAVVEQTLGTYGLLSSVEIDDETGDVFVGGVVVNQGARFGAVVKNPTGDQTIIGTYGLFFDSSPSGKFGFPDVFFRSLGNHTVVLYDGDINNINGNMELACFTCFGSSEFDTAGFIQGPGKNSVNIFRNSDSVPVGLLLGFFAHSVVDSEDESDPLASVDANGKVFSKVAPSFALQVFANNAAALAGGLAVKDFYRTGADPDVVCVVH